MGSPVTKLRASDATFDPTTGRLRIVVSAEEPDHDDEVVIPSTLRLDTYKSNPVVLWSHDQDQFPIATAPAVYLDADGRLVEEWEFGTTPEARSAAELYRRKILRGASIGFKSDGTRRMSPEQAFEKYGVRRALRVHTGGELIETSAVGVPSCPAALAAGWVDRPAAAKAARVGSLGGARIPGLVRKSLALLGRQATPGRKVRGQRPEARGQTDMPAAIKTDTTTKDGLDAPPPDDTAAEAPGHEEQISSNNRASAHAIVDAFMDGDIDAKAMMGKLKTLMKAHGDLTGSDTGEDDADAGDDTAIEEKDDEEDDMAEKGEGCDDEDDVKKSFGGLTTKAVLSQVVDAVDEIRGRLAEFATREDVEQLRSDLDSVVDTLGEVAVG